MTPRQLKRWIPARLAAYGDTTGGIGKSGVRGRPSLLALAAGLVILGGTISAQTPDCVSFFTFSTTPGAGILPIGPTPTADNRQTACINWTMVYESSGFTGVTLTFQSADGATAPGAFGAFSGTVLTGTNPATNTTRSLTTFNGYVGWFRVNLAVVGTGTLRGALYGYRNGFPPPATGPPCPGTVAVPCVVQQGPAGAVTAGWPVIDGQTANVTATWTPASGTPSLSIPISGYANVGVSCTKSGGLANGALIFEVSPDGSTWYSIGMEVLPGPPQTLVTTDSSTNCSRAWRGFVGGFSNFRVRLTSAITGFAASATFQIAAIASPSTAPQFVTVDAFGDIINNPLGAAIGLTDALTNTPTIPVTSAGGNPAYPVYPFFFNGATWDRSLKCPNATAIDDSTMGNTQVIALSGTTNIYICKLTLTPAAGVTIQLTQGTGANCAVAPVALSGIWLTVSAVAEDFLADQSVLVGAAGNEVCLNLGAGTRTTGTIYWAQY